MDRKSLLNALEVAEILGVAKGYVYKLVREHKIPCARIGSSKKTVRFNPIELEKWILALQQNNTGEVL